MMLELIASGAILGGQRVRTVYDADAKPHLGSHGQDIINKQ